MKNDELQQSAKVFCESISIAFTEEYFVMSLRSGKQPEMFVLTPQHAKRLAQYLTHQINEFETKHSKINTAWVPGVISPVQRVDTDT
jgi:hypothetical protein